MLYIFILELYCDDPGFNVSFYEQIKMWQLNMGYVEILNCLIFRWMQIIMGIPKQRQITTMERRSLPFRKRFMRLNLHSIRVSIDVFFNDMKQMLASNILINVAVKP